MASRSKSSVQTPPEFSVYLLGFPKSGNMLLWRLFKKIFGEEDSTPLDFNKIHELTTEFDQRPYGSVFHCHPFHLGKRVNPEYKMYHDMFMATDASRKTVGIVRDPRDVLVSVCHWHNPSKRVGSRNHAALASKRLYSDWARRWNNQNELIEAFCSRIVRYEDLIQNVSGYVRSAADYLDVDMTVERSFQIEKEVSPETAKGHARTATFGEWKTVLTKEAAESMHRIARERMESYGYLRDGYESKLKSHLVGKP